ncbi:MULTISPECIES: hypothetical protein [unclassified Streptomyces]|uniref:hypothetical protein n=1 Tax=unclassified Streptomyces TaxID=2593676 RepID=UPI002E282185|nr:hypothetical protein [Streptomyces sp. NBC_01423]WSX93841.1 hypothetical protein OH827_26390 [Streptomyces sp. NBC_00891]WSY08319.1 hypothetical protein OG464_26390 [Streptomyces sp. NBC_00890]WSZ09942.1 hypothetical protein OG704_26395 [Streptomyces sp. NBC_00869]WSZ22555.1 hypothetical protein OG498_07175 [Streptomyces sp. NBC_00870]
MEQRIDPKTQPAYAAGTDPAYIPGLTAPRPAEAVEEEPENGNTEEPAVADAVPEPADEAPVAQEEDEEEQEENDEEAADGPSFEVSDRRGSISAGPKGVRFTLDDQQADFGWDEIGAVELKPARFGRRFTVTVHLSSKRWFNGEVEAESRGSLKEWTEGFDAVLDTYFEES